VARSRLTELAVELRASVERSLAIYFRYPAQVVSDFLATPLWMLFFTLPILMFAPPESWSSPEFLAKLYWGWITLGILSSSFWSIGHAIEREAKMGTLEALFATNANRVVLFSGRVAVMVMSTLVEAAYVWALLHATFGFNPPVRDSAALLTAWILVIITAVGLSAAYGALVLRLKNPGALTNILQFALVVLTGAFFPVTSLPGPLPSLAMLIPLTYPVDLVRWASIGEETLLDPALEFALSAALAALSVALGGAALRAVEEENRRSGRLGFH